MQWIKGNWFKIAVIIMLIIACDKMSKLNDSLEYSNSNLKQIGNSIEYLNSDSFRAIREVEDGLGDINFTLKSNL